MKKIILFVLLLIVATNIFSKTILIQNPCIDDIYPNLQAAVNSAVNGDEIQLPSGTFSVSKDIIITKFISIKGKGMDSTILFRSETLTDALLNGCAIFRFNINSLLPSNIVVSGITFKSKSPSLISGDGLSLAKDMGIEMIKCMDFVITNCKFQYFGNGAISVTHDDSLVSGLIYENQFIKNYKGFDGLGLGYGVVVYGTGTKWISAAGLGSKNFIFIEDNFFDYHRHSIAAGGGGKYVARYNTCTHNIIDGPYVHCIDTHDGRGPGNGSNTYGTRAVEIYSNYIVNTTFIDGTAIVSGTPMANIEEKAIAIKSGDAVVYGNTISGYRFGIGLLSEHATGTYPYICQPGYLSGLKYGSSHTGIDSLKGNGDLFYWNNNFTPYISSPVKSSVGVYNYSSTYFVANRDYHNAVKPNYTAYTYPHPLRNI